MPVIEAFPLPSEGGPMWTVYYPQPPEFQVDVGTPYKSGGVDFWVRSDDKTYRFIFVYEGLDELEAQILDDHNESAFDTAYGFDFTDPRTGELFTSVHYEKYERPAHVKVKNQKRSVVLIKRP